MMIDAIERLGGTRPAARALGAPVSTVANWKKKGRVPRWWWPQIEQALRTRDDFEDQNRGRGDAQ